MVVLVGWLAVVLGVALGLKAGNSDRLLGKLMAGWWLFAAGVMTCLAGYWLVGATYFQAEELEAVAFQVCGGVMLLVGTFLVPFRLGQIVHRHREALQELKDAATPKSRGPAKVPAWKQVEGQ